MAACYVKAYFDWIEQTAALSDAERGRLFIAVLQYARSGLDPKLDGRESILFPAFKATIDRDEKRAAASAENGKRGGKPKTKTNLTKPNLTKTNLTKPNSSNKEKEEDKEKEKDEELYPPRTPPLGGDLSPKLQEAVNAWLRYKAEKRQAYKPTGEKALISEIRNNAEKYGEDAVIDLIKQCMSANWQGIIFDRLKKETVAKGGDKNAWMDDYTW